VRVSVIEPGAVATELREHIGHAQVQKAIARLRNNLIQAVRAAE